MITYASGGLRLFDRGVDEMTCFRQHNNAVEPKPNTPGEAQDLGCGDR